MSKTTLRTAAPFVILVIVSLLALFVPSATNFDNGKYNGADIAWMIVLQRWYFL
jgi:Amt family ammonium transporter